MNFVNLQFYCPTPLSETHAKVVKPEFVKPLHSADIPEGSSLTLECHVTGTPSPTISWFRGDENIDRSPDYILSFVDGVCALRVRKVVKEQHGGEYTCKAANSAGDVATAARVQVISMSQ